MSAPPPAHVPLASASATTRSTATTTPPTRAEPRTATAACTPAARGPGSYHGSLGRPGGGSLLIATISTEFRFRGRIPVTRHATTRSTYVPGLDGGGPVLPPFPSTNL